MKKEFIRKRMGNGLAVLFEKRKQEVVSISASVKQGSAYESEKEKGISHFVEHLMFKGTKNRTNKEIAEEIEKKGGVLNAFTDEEVTSYWNKMPNKHFNSGASIVSDLILHPRFDPIEFEKEKKVVLEEIKMYRDNPSTYVLYKLKELLYKKPFGLATIGNAKSISSLSRTDVINFFLENYATNKMILCVVGNTNMESIEKFGMSFPKNKAKEKEFTPVKINKQLIEKRRGIDQANLALGFHLPCMNDKARYAAEIFNIILAHGMSSKLFEEIREKRGLAYDIRGMLEQGKSFGYEIIYSGTTKENVKKCKEIILKEAKEMANLANKDFEEGKEQLIGLRKVESEESINVMNALAEEEAAGNANEFYNYENRIGRVLVNEVRKLAKIKGYSSLALIPK